MKKKDILVLKYKMVELVPKGKSTEEPDWESMKISPEAINRKYEQKYSWVKKTFTKSGVISIEDIEDGSLVNHKEGVFVVNTKFKKLFKLIYK